MANELTLFKNGLMQRSKVFDAIKGEEHALSAGVGPGFARITYKGGKWGLKYQGETRMFRRYIYRGDTPIDDGPNPKLDVVILKVAEKASKYFYMGAYTEGDSNPPDCWSTNGIVPDSGAPRKQSPTCAGCPHNAWGSAKAKADGTPSRGKACTDHKRLVVVPAGDIENKAYGGPMLLLVPPTSLKKLAPYEQKLAHAGFRFMEVWTQLTFVEDSAFPLFEFDAVQPLDDAQGQMVLKMRNDDMVQRILTVEVEAVEGYDQPEYAAPEKPAPAPGQTIPDPTPPPVKATAPAPTPMPPPAATPAPAPSSASGVAAAAPAPAPAAAAPNPVAALAELLKTMTPEQLASLGLGQPQQAEKKTRRARTPAPSPKPMDTTPTPTELDRQMGQPHRRHPANDDGEPNGEANIDDIMSKIDNLIPRTE